MAREAFYPNKIGYRPQHYRLEVVDGDNLISVWRSDSLDEMMDYVRWAREDHARKIELVLVLIHNELEPQDEEEP